jgi:hypothetical protein
MAPTLFVPSAQLPDLRGGPVEGAGLIALRGVQEALSVRREALHLSLARHTTLLDHRTICLKGIDMRQSEWSW